MTAAARPPHTLLMLIRTLALALAFAAPAAAQTAPPTSSLFEVQSLRAPASTVATGRALVSAADPRAAAAGAAMLRRGGSAADAAAATLIALTVVEPQSSGLGGGGFLMFHDGRTGELVSIDGRETAPADATPARFLDAAGKPRPQREAVWGALSVGVPGNTALIAAMHRRWGKLPWAALFEPSIALARDGTTLTPRFARILAARREMVAASPVARRFARADGAPLAAGARIVQPELAATLAAIARGGPEVFYRGAVAREITRALAASPRNPARVTAADLAGYRVVERRPLCGTYRGWRVCGIAPPSSGGLAVLAILKQLERFDLKRLGRDNPLSWHLLAESQRLAFADREAWIADPGFVAVPTDGLSDPAYLARRSALIRIDRAMPRALAGDPPGAPAAPAPAQGAEAGTSHMVAVDAAGNVASLTSTIESIFGSGVTAGGMFLNNELTDFDLAPVRDDGRPAPNRVEPGKRPRSSMAPTIVYAPGGRVALALGAAGGATIIAQVAKTIIAHIDWGLPIAEAIAEPTLFARGERLAYERGSRLERMAAAWKALGHAEVSAADLPTKGNAAARTASGWTGAADPRTEGQAVAAP